MIRVIKYLIVLIFINHLACTALYLTPLNPLSNYYLRYVHTYMTPLFTQNWKLFAPEPSLQYQRLWFRCSALGKSSNWLDPNAEMVSKHQMNRFASYGKILYVQDNIARSLVTGFYNKLKAAGCYQDGTEGYPSPDCDKKMEPAKLRFQQSSEFKNAARYIASLCQKKHEFQTRDLSVEFKIATIDAIPYSKRKDPRYIRKIKAISFPEYRISEL